MTVSNHQAPSINPANYDSLAGMLRQVMEKAQATTDNALPAVVLSYDRTSNRATVRPLVRIITTGGQTVSRASYANLPVIQIGAGGFVLNFPIKPGDVGYIHACDRDVSLVLQGGVSEAQPNSLRMHSFSDGFFIPITVTPLVTATEDADAVALQSVDGAARLAVHSDHVKATSEHGLMVADADGVPENGAVFQIDSTLKAAIPWPRMTQAQRDLIPDPVTGMAVWLIPEERLSTYAHGAWS